MKEIFYTFHCVHAAVFCFCVLTHVQVVFLRMKRTFPPTWKPSLRCRRKVLRGRDQESQWELGAKFDLLKLLSLHRF